MSKMGRKFQEKLDYISYQEISDENFNESRIEQITNHVITCIKKDKDKELVNYMKKLSGKKAEYSSTKLLGICRKLLGY